MISKSVWRHYEIRSWQMPQCKYGRILHIFLDFSFYTPWSHYAWKTEGCDWGWRVRNKLLCTVRFSFMHLKDFSKDAYLDDAQRYKIIVLTYHTTTKVFALKFQLAGWSMIISLTLNLHCTLENSSQCSEPFSRILSSGTSLIFSN